MNTLDKLKDEKERLGKQLDVVEQKIKDYKNKTIGIPRVGSNAYFLEGNGVIIYGIWADTNYDWEYWNQGNYYLTNGEAIAESKRRTIHQEIKAYANECNGEIKVDWLTYTQDKFYISADTIHKEIHIFPAYCFDYPNQVYFINEEDLEKCIEVIGKDRLLKDYFQVTTGKQLQENQHE